MNTLKFTEEGLLIPYPQMSTINSWDTDKQTLTDLIDPIERYWGHVKSAIQRGTYRWINAKNAALYQEWEAHLKTSAHAATFWNEFIIDILPIFRRMIISNPNISDSSKLIALNHLSEWELFISAR